MTLSDEERYAGFSKETIERYEREAEAIYDPEIVRESRQRLSRMSPEQWQQVKEEGGAITLALAGMIDRAVSDADVQALVARQHAWIENFYAAPLELFRGLGRLYRQHPEFRANYEQYAAGLADFLGEAIDHYCDHRSASNA